MKIQLKRAMLIEGKGVEADAIVNCDTTIAEALLAMGDATVVVDAPDDADVVEIETIDHLKARLVEYADYISELEKSNEALEAENSELKKANSKLEATNDKLNKKLKEGGSTDAS
ncbi:MAG: hypothetical protein ACKO37_09995 [Vampirovibrionales bacterium]